jgi:hypothetical protein
VRAQISIVLLCALLSGFGCSKSGHGVTGEWTIHRGNAADHFTLKDDGGVLTGSIEIDPGFGGGTYDVHGVHAGANVELHYQDYVSNSTPGDSGPVYYTLKGTIDGDSMSGTLSLLGPFSSKVDNPNETILWVANREK